MTWAYTFMNYDQHSVAHPCQGDSCSKRATYRLVAENGKDTGARSFCTNHSAEAANRLGLAFPPINSPQALTKGIK